MTNQNDQNEIIEVTFVADDGQAYRCVGVRVYANSDTTQIAFSAKNDKIIDYLTIKTASITSSRLIADGEIAIVE